MDNKIKKTIAFITGGASGIGKAVASRIIDNGGRVIIVDTNPAGWEVAKDFGDRARFVNADVSSEDNVKAALELAKATFGVALKEVSKRQFASIDVVNLSPKRRGSPDEIAHVIQCIIENAFINAEVIRVDGGYRFVPPITN